MFQPFSKTSAEQGFSLIEAMVALAIFSLAAISSLTLITQNLRSASLIEVKQTASFLADNLLIEARLELELPVSESDGTAEMGGYDFEWSRIVEETGQGQMKRIVIFIRQSGGSQTIVERTGFRNG